MKMITGTSNFVSLAAAINYYQPYENNPAKAVERKLQEGSIHIGPPKFRAEKEKIYANSEGRYMIESLF